tara:strand:- start:446 stop:784 length:339 start_codon:yes stop_codon:yes gene_type:complete
MKRLLLPLLAALALPAQVNANVDPKINEMCLKAADYKGCVELNSKKVSLPKCNFFRRDNCIREETNDYGKYVGQWKDGERTGQGTYYWNDGSSWTGEFLNGKRTENGSYNSN